MPLHGYRLSKSEGDIRFQDLENSLQEKIVNCLERGVIPELEDPRITIEVLRRWYADKALLKFWVNQKSKRG